MFSSSESLLSQICPYSTYLLQINRQLYLSFSRLWSIASGSIRWIMEQDKSNGFTVCSKRETCYMVNWNSQSYIMSWWKGVQPQWCRICYCLLGIACLWPKGRDEHQLLKVPFIHLHCLMICLEKGGWFKGAPEDNSLTNLWSFWWCLQQTVCTKTEWQQGSVSG